MIHRLILYVSLCSILACMTLVRGQSVCKIDQYREGEAINVQQSGNLDGVNASISGVHVSGGNFDELLESCSTKCCHLDNCTVATLNVEARGPDDVNCFLVTCQPLDQCVWEKGDKFQTVSLLRPAEDGTSPVPPSTTSPTRTGTTVPPTQTSPALSGTSPPGTGTTLPPMGTTVAEGLTSPAETTTRQSDTGTSPPRTETSLPITTTAIPNTVRSTSDTAIPAQITDTSPPQTGTTMPVATTSLPSTAMPLNDVSLPVTTTSLPQTETALPETSSFNTTVTVNQSSAQTSTSNQSVVSTVNVNVTTSPTNETTQAPSSPGPNSDQTTVIVTDMANTETSAVKDVTTQPGTGTTQPLFLSTTEKGYVTTVLTTQPVVSDVTTTSSVSNVTTETRETSAVISSTQSTESTNTPPTKSLILSTILVGVSPQIGQGSSTPNLTITNSTEGDSDSHNFLHFISPSMDNATIVGLVGALVFGVVFLVAVVVLVGRRCYDSWKKRHYTKVDYLVNGMYN